ncbi:hypothetical protein [Streptosporangium sandarakinum]
MSEVQPGDHIAVPALQPGDVVTDGAGHLWFICGRPEFQLWATAPDAQCVGARQVEAFYGALTLVARHGAGRQPEDVEDRLNRTAVLGGDGPQ